MSLHKQSDVKNHLSPRYRTKIHLCEPVSGAVGLSGAELDAIKAAPLDFGEDFLGEHSSSGAISAPAGLGSIPAVASGSSVKKRASVNLHSVFLRGITS